MFALLGSLSAVLGDAVFSLGTCPQVICVCSEWSFLCCLCSLQHSHSQQRSNSSEGPLLKTDELPPSPQLARWRNKCQGPLPLTAHPLRLLPPKSPLSTHGSVPSPWRRGVPRAGIHSVPREGGDECGVGRFLYLFQYFHGLQPHGTLTHSLAQTLGDTLSDTEAKHTGSGTQHTHPCLQTCASMNSGL